MRINAAQIRGSKYIGSLRGVFLGHAKVEKDASTKFAQSVDVKNLGFPTFLLTVSAFDPFPSLPSSTLSARKTIGQLPMRVKSEWARPFQTNWLAATGSYCVGYGGMVASPK